MPTTVRKSHWTQDDLVQRRPAGLLHPRPRTAAVGRRSRRPRGGRAAPETRKGQTGAHRDPQPAPHGGPPQTQEALLQRVHGVWPEAVGGAGRHGRRRRRVHGDSGGAQLGAGGGRAESADPVGGEAVGGHPGGQAGDRQAQTGSAGVRSALRRPAQGPQASGRHRQRDAALRRRRRPAHRLDHPPSPFPLSSPLSPPRNNNNHLLSNLRILPVAPRVIERKNRCDGGDIFLPSHRNDT